MSEGNRDAAILIAISFQALNRVIRGGGDTRFADCTVLILFAGFYIEATLNYIIDFIGRRQEMAAFLGAQYPGMQDKLAWFYNEFVARTRVRTKKRLYKTGIAAKLRRRFQGFGKLNRFRNDISHGQINSSAAAVETAKKLRRQAKVIVTELYDIVSKAGHPVPRLVNYWKAIGSIRNHRHRGLTPSLLQNR